MRAFSLSVGLACSGFALAHQGKIHARQSDSAPDYPVIPSYTIDMPVDHFSSGDIRTYKNRFYVNDTYYQPGGPVIVHGSGESSVTPFVAAENYAEYGGVITAPMELARQLNAIVIGWEHRYYGKSLPVALDASGVAVGGVKDYEYLNPEQAMEDLVYFANNFNKTTLSDNNVVQSTANLDPYNTPWIYIGGSYSGALAAFVRIRNPEIFYASWSSSAPVQASYDGSQYYNQLYRTLPSNCSTDLKQVIESFNEIVNSGDQTQVEGLTNIAYVANNGSYIAPSEKWGTALTGVELALALSATFQDNGPINTTHWFCDYLETFDGVAYQNSISSNNAGLGGIFDNPIENPFDRVATDEGIIAAYGDNGLMVAQAAFFYAINTYSTYWQANSPSAATVSPDGNLTDLNELDSVGDSPSWTWQTLATFGFEQGFNATTNKGMEIVMESATRDEVRKHSVLATFPELDLSAFPATPNVSAALQYGGWDMTPSNVMFTNGELDPWRSFGVMSLEHQIGAPKRTIVQTLPKCNEAPDGTDLFGLLYDNQVHCKDMWSYIGDGPSSPTQQAADLFAKAYNSWAPCFNQSRDAVRNGKQPDGSDKTNAAARYGPGQIGLWSILGLSSVIYSVI